MSLCEVHGRLLSGTAGSILRRDSRGKREARPFRSLVFLLFFFRSGQEQRATITSCKRGTRRITMTERTMTVRESSNCASPIYFSSHKRHDPRVLVESLHQYLSTSLLSFYALTINAVLFFRRFFSPRQIAVKEDNGLFTFPNLEKQIIRRI